MTRHRANYVNMTSSTKPKLYTAHYNATGGAIGLADWPNGEGKTGSRVCLSSLALFHYSCSVSTLGINLKTSNSYHLQDLISTHSMSLSYPNVLLVANLNSLKDRRDKLLRTFFRNMCKQASCLHHLLPPIATLLQFLGYVLAHHFLAQPHEQKSSNHL